MKKRITSLVLALLLCLTLLPAAFAEEAEDAFTEVVVPEDMGGDPAPVAPIAGGWVMAEDTTVTPERKALFEKAVAGIDGASFIPLVYEASQVVAGTNHRFLAEQTVNYPEAETVEVRVWIYEDLDGNAEVYDVEELEPIDIIDDPEPVEGGWVDAEDTTVTPELKDIFDRAVAGIVGVSLEPTAYEKYQIVAGMNHCFRALRTGVYPGAEPEEVLVFIYEDMEGNVEVTDVDEIEPEGPVSGGWIEAEDTTVTPELRALFDLAVENMCIVGVSYEPTAYMAYQVVAGTNHRFLALCTVVVPDAEPREVIITIYEDPAGNAEVTDIEPLEPIGTDPTVTVSADLSYAEITGSFDGLYARVALSIDRNGQSGLYVTQASISDDGVISIPAFHVPGLIVTGVNVALVPSLGDITSPTPTVLASDTVFPKSSSSGGDDREEPIYAFEDGIEIRELGVKKVGLYWRFNYKVYNTTDEDMVFDSTKFVLKAADGTEIKTYAPDMSPDNVWAHNPTTVSVGVKSQDKVAAGDVISVYWGETFLGAVTAAAE